MTSVSKCGSRRARSQDHGIAAARSLCANELGHHEEGGLRKPAIFETIEVFFDAERDHTCVLHAQGLQPPRIWHTHHSAPGERRIPTHIDPVVECGEHRLAVQL